jgi:hypothetical protein
MILLRHSISPATTARVALSAVVALTLLGASSAGVCLEAKPQAAGGSLQVTSEPVGATVYLDGKLTGRTPLALEAVAAGDHRLTLVSYGHLENHQIVSVVSGQTVTFHVHLVPSDDVAGTKEGASVSPGHQGAQPEAPGAPSAGQSLRPRGTRSGGILKNKKKLLMIGAPVIVGGGVAGYLLASKNSPPTTGTISVEPADVTGIVLLTSFKFDAHAVDGNGDSLDYLWEFGDGGTSPEATPAHVYQTANTFAVKVTVTDRKVTATTSTSVTVAALTGTWSGTLSTGMSVTLALLQQGTTLTGSLRYSTTGLALAVRGQVTGTRGVQLTFDDGSSTHLTGTVSSDAKTITGKLDIAGTSIADLTLRR